MPDATTARRWLDRRVVERVYGGRERFWVIVALSGVLAVDAADKGMVGATVTKLQAAFGIGPAAVGLMVTVSGLVAVVATLPFGALVDRVSRLRLLRVVIVTWAIAMAMGAAAPSFGWLVVSRLVLGLASAAAGPAVASLVGDWFASEERARVMGLVLAGELVGTGAGLVVGVAMAWLWWRLAFAAVALLSLLVVRVLGRLTEPSRDGSDTFPRPERSSMHRRGRRAPRRERVAGPGEAADDLPEPDSSVVAAFDGYGDLAHAPLRTVVVYVVRVRTNIVLMLSSALGYYVFAGLRTFGFEFAEVRYGASPAAVVVVVGVAGLAGLVGVVTGGRLADRLLSNGWARVRVVLPALTLLAMAAAFVPAVLVTSLAIAVPLLVAAAVFLALSNPPLDAARLDVLPPPLRGRAESIKTVLRSGLEAVAPVAFGATAQLLGSGGSGLVWAMLIGAVPLLVSPVLLLVYGRRAYLGDVATASAVGASSARRAAGG